MPRLFYNPDGCNMFEKKKPELLQGLVIPLLHSPAGFFQFCATAL